jgi:hypothetical protein
MGTTQPALAEVNRPTTTEAARAATTDIRASDSPTSAEKPETKEEPVYKVFMPPPRFGTSATVQPGSDPELILLVRRARVPDFTTLYRFLQRLDDKTIDRAVGETARRLRHVGHAAPS